MFLNIDRSVAALWDDFPTLCLSEVQGNLSEIGRKTTTAAKLALHLKKTSGKQVLLVPADVHRPAATEQLRTLAKENGLLAFDPKSETDAVARTRAAVKEAKAAQKAARKG